MKAKRAGSGHKRKNMQCFISESQAQGGKAIELIAGYRSFPPVGPIWHNRHVKKHHMLPVAKSMAGAEGRRLNASEQRGGRPIVRNGESGVVIVCVGDTSWMDGFPS
jgi:hypothetical protein